MDLWQEFNNIDTRDYARRHPELFAYVRQEMAKPGKQYLLLGDTNHLDPELMKFKRSPALAALFNRAAIPNVCVEWPREMATPERIADYKRAWKSYKSGKLPLTTMMKEETKFWDRYHDNVWELAADFEIESYSKVLKELNKTVKKIKEMVGQRQMKESAANRFFDAIKYVYNKGARDFIGAEILGFSHAGLRVIAADSFQWREKLIPTLSERIFLGDREVADYIRKQTGSEKTAIIYGAAHFHYKSTMADYIDPEKSVHIDIYSNRRNYEALNRIFKPHAEILPDKVYILDEGSLEDPDVDLYCGNDGFLSHCYYEEERKDIERRYKPDPGFLKRLIWPRREITKLPEIDSDYFNYRPPANSR